MWLYNSSLLKFLSKSNDQLSLQYCAVCSFNGKLLGYMKISTAFYGSLWQIQLHCVLTGSTINALEGWNGSILILPPPCFTVGIVFLRSYTQPIFLQTWAKLLPKFSIFVFVWPENIVPKEFWFAWMLLGMRRVHIFLAEEFCVGCRNWGDCSAVHSLLIVLYITAVPTALSPTAVYPAFSLTVPSLSLVWEHVAHTSGDDSLWFHEHSTNLQFAQ